MDDDPKPAKPKFSLPNYADDNKLDFEAGLQHGEEMDFKKLEPKNQKPRLGNSTSSGVDQRSGSAPNNNRPRGGGMKHGQGRQQNQQPKRQQIVYDEDPF